MSTCQTCRDVKPDSTRYCAPNRCYCGHESCPAYPSWVEAERLAPVTNINTAKSRAAELWADREEPTWLDM